MDDNEESKTNAITHNFHATPHVHHSPGYPKTRKGGGIKKIKQQNKPERRAETAATQKERATAGPATFFETIPMTTYIPVPGNGKTNQFIILKG